jgi:HEAT repeat protein
MKVAGDRNAEVRMSAVISLGHFRDERVVELLMSTLEYDGDYYVQCIAAKSLGDLRSPRAVPVLLALLRRTKWDAESNSELRVSAIWALGRIGDERAVEPLIALLGQPLEDMEETMCGHENSTWRAISGALADIGSERAIGYLMRSLREGNAGAVSGAYRYFIGRGIAGSEPVLTHALSRYGDYTMACYFALSGNNRLREAARVWAKKDRRPIEPNDYVRKHAARWGADRQLTTED